MTAKATPAQQNTVNRYLISSIAAGNMERFHLCLQKGGDIRMREEGTERTLLMVAISRHPATPALARVLIENGVDLLAKDRHGKTAFDYADDISEYSWRKQMVDTLLKALPDAEALKPQAPETPAGEFNAQATATGRALPAAKPISFDEDGGEAAPKGKQFKL